MRSISTLVVLPKLIVQCSIWAGSSVLQWVDEGIFSLPHARDLLPALPSAERTPGHLQCQLVFSFHESNSHSVEA